MKYLEMSGMASRARGSIMRRSAGRHQPYLSFAPVTLVTAQALASRDLPRGGCPVDMTRSTVDGPIRRWVSPLGG